MASAEAPQEQAPVPLPMAQEVFRAASRPIAREGFVHQSLVEALSAFQAEVQTFPKNKTAKVVSKRTGQSYTYKYADLADFLPTVGPALARHGLCWTSKPVTMEDGTMALVYALTHVSGQSETGSISLGIKAGAAMQELGSAITYARRYAMTAQLNISADEDEDGRTVETAPVEESRRSQAQAQVKPSERPANANQRGAINGRMADAGLSANQQKAILNWTAGVGQLDRVPAAKASELIEALGDDGTGAAEILNEIATEAEQGNERAQKIVDRFFTTEE